MLIIILKFCLSTRITFFLLQVLVSLLPDHNADAYIDQSSEPHPLIIEKLFGGFDNWDSQYYMTIAEKGYTEEQFLVFFPLYPFLMRFIAGTILFPLSFILPFRSILLLSGWIISNISFVLATLLLYKLTNKLTSNQLLSLYSCFFFCLNPASVFMCTVYTESLFACSCFAGMLAITNSQPYTASLWFGLATATRSNGMLTIGFLLYFHFQDQLVYLVTSSHRQPFSQIIKHSLIHLLQLFVQVLFVLLPFLSFQVYGYRFICYRNADNSHSLPPTLCNHSMPFVYSYIQSKYWNLGLMSYYEIKQIPNFLLALPMALLLMGCIKTYFDKNTLIKIFSRPLSIVDHKKHNGFKGNFSLISFMVHGLFLLMIAFTVMHIQVITRFVCSSSPIIYWFCSALLLDYYHKTRPLPSRIPTDASHLQQTLYDLLKSLTVFHYHSVHFILLYFLLYLLLGFVLHCNFLPWT